MTLRFVITFFLCCYTFIADAQARDSVIKYFDKDWETVTTRADAAYFRTVAPHDGKFIVRDYFISGKIQMVAECSQTEPEDVIEGRRVSYYENGNVEHDGLYHHDVAVGVHKYYYPDGKPERHMRYAGDNPAFYIQAWSPSGEALLTKGRGTISKTDNDGENVVIEIENSITIGVYSVIGRDTIYRFAEQMAQFPDGLAAMTNFISSNLRYPQSARRLGIEGVAFITFVIDKRGNVTGAKVMKAINPDIDAEALRVVKAMPAWTPGKVRGKLVKCRFILPVRFRLTGDKAAK